jgi:hypothetical protein
MDDDVEIPSSSALLQIVSSWVGEEKLSQEIPVRLLVRSLYRIGRSDGMLERLG